MIGLERKRYILNRLYEKGSVSLSDIASELNTSIATVRRDFDKLVNEKIVERVHGGAVLIQSNTTSLNIGINPQSQLIAEKEKHSYIEKVEIAKKAASYISDGDNVYLDDGTTVAQMIDFLVDKKITIVTPNLLVVEKAKAYQNSLDIIVVGGKYSYSHESTYGSLSEQQIQQFSYNIAFFGCSGIDFEKGNVYYDESDVSALKLPAFINADKKILLADSTKLNKKNLWSFLETSKFNHIISTLKSGDNREYPDNVVWTNK